VGGCLGQAGLKRRTGLGLATLIIAANVPDVDVLAILAGRDLELRRGWTHGLLALAVWPLVLAGVMWTWSRVAPRALAAPVRFRELVLLSGIGVATHPALDFLNTYGMRWLMPFQDRWFYGDTLFIIDPWLWALLAAALWLARRRERSGRPNPGRPARVALAAGTVYIGAMMTATLVARREIARDLPADARFMVAPVPVVPFERRVVVDDGAAYRVARHRFGGGSPFALEPAIPKGDQAGLAPLVGRTREGAAFLRWARFPVYESETTADSTRIRVYDLRYADRASRGWATFEVSVPRSAVDGDAPPARHRPSTEGGRGQVVSAGGAR
jgi:inner membrane protein